MSNLQKLLKEQEEELNEYGVLHNEDCCCNFEDSRACDANVELLDCCENMRGLKSFIQSYNTKIIKAVCEEMTGKEENPKDRYSANYHDTAMCDKGYNKRIEEENEKAKELINETNQ